MYYLRLHKVMALRPNLGVIVAGGWAGGESYNGRSKPLGAFFLGLFLFCSGHYNYQEIFIRISLKCSLKSILQQFFYLQKILNLFQDNFVANLVDVCPSSYDENVVDFKAFLPHQADFSNTKSQGSSLLYK